MAELYRLQVGKRRGGASWGDVELFESHEAFQSAVADALLDVEEKKAKGWRLRLLRRWREIRGKKETEVRVDRVFAIQELVDGEWVDLHATLVPPSLEITR